MERHMLRQADIRWDEMRVNYPINVERIEELSDYTEDIGEDSVLYTCNFEYNTLFIYREGSEWYMGSIHSVNTSFESVKKMGQVASEIQLLVWKQ